MLSDGLLRSRFLARDAFDAGASIQLDFQRRIFRKGGQRTSTFAGLTGASFSRASIGYADSWRGQPRQFASGAPRNSDLGQLFENAATNLVLQSQTFDTTWVPAGMTLTANAGVAPDGSATADRLIVNNGQQVIRTHIQQASVGTLSGVYNLSMYIRPVDVRYVGLSEGNGVGWVDAWFDLAAGVVLSTNIGANARITPLSDGWFRISCDTVNKGVAAAFNPVLDVFKGGIGDWPIGDGNRGVMIWGAQMTAGAGEKAYIPTTTAAVTRLADAATLTYAQPAACTFIAEIIVPTSAGAGAHQVMLSGNSGYTILNFNTGSLDLRGYTSTTPIVLAPGTPVRGQVYRAAVAYNGANVRGCGTGAVAVSNTAGAAPDLTTLNIGNSGGTNGLNSIIRKVLVFDRAFTDAELLAAVGV